MSRKCDINFAAPLGRSCPKMWQERSTTGSRSRGSALARKQNASEIDRKRLADSAGHKGVASWHNSCYLRGPRPTTNSVGWADCSHRFGSMASKTLHLSLATSIVLSGILGTHAQAGDKAGAKHSVCKQDAATVQHARLVRTLAGEKLVIGKWKTACARQAAAASIRSLAALELTTQRAASSQHTLQRLHVELQV